MMRAGKGALINAVVDDRQWVRRVKQEEINMIDSMAAQGALLGTNNKGSPMNKGTTSSSFYPQHMQMKI